MPEDTLKVHRVGSRKSELALIQTRFVISELEKLCPGHSFTIVEVQYHCYLHHHHCHHYVFPLESSRNSIPGIDLEYRIKMILHRGETQWLLSSLDQIVGLFYGLDIIFDQMTIVTFIIISSIISYQLPFHSPPSL